MSSRPPPTANCSGCGLSRAEYPESFSAASYYCRECKRTYRRDYNGLKPVPRCAKCGAERSTATGRFHRGMCGACRVADSIDRMPSVIDQEPSRLTHDGKICWACGDLPWRRRKPVCRRCGQPYGPEPPVSLVTSGRRFGWVYPDMRGMSKF